MTSGNKGSTTSYTPVASQPGQALTSKMGETHNFIQLLRNPCKCAGLEYHAMQIGIPQTRNSQINSSLYFSNLDLLIHHQSTAVTKAYIVDRILSSSLSPSAKELLSHEVHELGCQSHGFVLRWSSKDLHLGYSHQDCPPIQPSWLPAILICSFILW